jgi:RNA polymerase sigma factor (TIGR02999 family)
MRPSVEDLCVPVTNVAGWRRTSSGIVLESWQFSATIHDTFLANGYPGKSFIEGTALGSTFNLSSLLEAAEAGDLSAADALFSVLYSELHRIAKRELARQGVPVSVGPTTLLHQAYIEMAEREGISFPDRARFMGYAARVMRGLIIDHARRRHAQKRGGQFELTSAETEFECAPVDRDLSRISEALDELAKTEPPLAELVDLKFFCGFSFAEIAAMRNVSQRTVQRQWEKARIYLYHSIRMNVETE